MDIVNEDKQIIGGEITPNGDVACFVACGVVCIISGFTGTAIGVAFMLG